VDLSLLSPSAAIDVPRVFISAGEASGDHYGAELMRQMRRRDETLEFFGLAGAEMQSEGCRPIVRAQDVAHMGITEVIRHAPFIYQQLQKLKRSLTDNKPALAVLIDFPDVNFRLAKRCHALGIPVLWLVSPQLWAWKKRRLRWVQTWVTRMMVIFPFEESFYRECGVDAEFIGHPLADLLVPTITRAEFAAKYSLDAARPWIALLPGSRAKEFALHFPVMRQAAEMLGDSYEFLVPIASTLNWETYAQMVAAAKSARLTPVHDAREALFHARASVVASGTATVQAALMGNPFVIVYRMSGLSFFLARRFVSVKFAGMPNLIAGQEIVPELLQNDFYPLKVASTLRPMLNDDAVRARIQHDLAAVRTTLSPPAALPNLSAKPENGNSGTAMARAADAALAILKSTL
jgi:lipid-A-disaccharide synthase